MGFSGKDLIKQVEDSIRSEVKQSLKNKLKPFQSEIFNEGASVRIIEKSDINRPFVISISNASDELKEKILKAIK